MPTTTRWVAVISVALYLLAETGRLAGSAQAPTIRHQGLEYVSSRQFTRVAIEVDMPDQIRTAKLYFRAEQYSDFYYVEMIRDDDDRFVGILPMPLIEAGAVVYFIEVTDVTFATFRTAPYHSQVTTQLQASSFEGTEPGIRVGSTTSGQPPVPPGFSPDGIDWHITPDGELHPLQDVQPPPPPPPPPDDGGGAGKALLVIAGAAGATGAGLAVLGKKDDGPGPEPLTACFTTSPDPPNIGAGQRIRLDGSCSQPAASITSYQWDLGDGRSRQSISINPVYQTPGTFNVSLTVSDGAQTARTSRTVTVVATQAGLTITKRDTAGGNVKVGQSFGYEIEVTNNGPADATSVLLTDPVPSGLALGPIRSSSNATCGLEGRTVTCRAQTLPANRRFTVNFEVTAQEVGSTITNRARVTSNESSPRTAEVTTNVDAAPSVNVDLSLAKSDSKDPVRWDESFTYTLTVRNGGPGDATRVTLTDTLPSNASLKGADPGCVPRGRDVVCSLGNLSVGGSATVDIVASFASGDICNIIPTTSTNCSGVSSNCCLNNTAFVSSNEIDSSTTNNTATERTSVTGVLLQRQSRVETSFVSVLEVPGNPRARGNVRLNGVRVDATDSSTPFRHTIRGRDTITVEAQTVSRIQGEGVWRFDFSGDQNFTPGSITVELGQVLTRGASTVAFRLSGAPGEHIKFTYRLRR